MRAAAVENLRKVLPFLDKGNDEEIPLALTQIALAETQEEEEEEREDVEDDGDDGDGGEPLKKKRDEGDDDVVVERDVLPPLLLLTFLPTTTVRVAARAQNVFMCLRVSARVLLLLSRILPKVFNSPHHTSFFFEEGAHHSWEKNVMRMREKDKKKDTN